MSQVLNSSTSVSLTTVSRARYSLISKLSQLIIVQPNSSVSLKMTPDGGYTLARNPGKSGDVANLSFLVSNDTEAVDYETMRYLYLNNLDTTAGIYVKAKFVSNIYPGGETWDGQLVYENGGLPPESNTTITIDLKEKMGAAWAPEGKILCLQFWVEHGGADKRMNLSSIWLGAEGADMTETAIRSAEPVDFSQATVAGGTTASDSAHPDGFVFNQTGTGANVTKEVDVSLSETPYAYIHVTGYTTAGVAQLFNLYILPEGSYDAADGGVGLGSKPVNLRTDSLQGDSEYWLRLDLREYFSAAKQAKDPLGVVFSAQPTGDSATLKIGGMYVGGAAFQGTGGSGNTDNSATNPAPKPSPSTGEPLMPGAVLLFGAAAAAAIVCVRKKHN